MRMDTFYENLQLKLYKKLSGFPLTKHMIFYIRTRYALLKPASEKSIILGTMKILNRCILAIAILSLCSIMLRGASIYTYLIWFSLYFMVTGQIIRGSLWKGHPASACESGGGENHEGQDSRGFDPGKSRLWGSGGDTGDRRCSLYFGSR